MAIKLFWWGGDTGGVNFGDSISPLIVAAVSGKEVVHRTIPHCDMTAVGSLLDTVVRKQWQRDLLLRFNRVKVWGSGSFKPYRIKHHRRLDVFAVRGPLTRDAMNLKRDLAMGDPALLIDRLIPKIDKKYRWGIIPHVIDFNESVVADINNNTPNSLVINLRNPNLLETAKEIASCDFVLSSSLHGIIVADALGVPHAWTKITGKVFHADWKFSDYFMSVEREAPAPVSLVEDLRTIENLTDLSSRQAIERRQLDLESSFSAMNL